VSPVIARLRVAEGCVHGQDLNLRAAGYEPEELPAVASAFGRECASTAPRKSLTSRPRSRTKDWPSVRRRACVRASEASPKCRPDDP